MADALLDEILAEIEYEEPNCIRCGRPMVPERQWTAASQEEKWELWLEGYEAYGRGKARKDRCNPCSFQSGPLREDELEIRDARRLRILAYKDLLNEGVTDVTEQAKRLGITRQALVRLIENWKKRGWL